MPRRKHLRRAVNHTTVEQRTAEKNNSGNHANPVQLAQSAPNYIAGQMSGRQNGKRRRREHKCKEDEPADPADQRQEHKKTQKGHSRGLYRPRAAAAESVRMSYGNVFNTSEKLVQCR